MDTPYQLPQNFLSHPAPEVEKQIVDFKASDLPEYHGYYACILDHVFSAEECADMIRAAKAQTDGEWQQATINSGFSGQEVDTESRLCGRIIWSNEELAAKIWARCQPHVPEILEVKDAPHITGGTLLMKGWKFGLIGLNESMRFLRYFDGNYFRRRTQEGKISFFTLHLYLNEPDEDSMLEGGATTFHASDWSGRKFDVVPKIGRVLLFQQKGLLHSGADVKRGIKFTMRTDVMYKKVD
ncbi:MAG: hypothetical protein LQ344_006030 [Seirophora lacunosa]|nr:MAG: hypothetical protein LQ344_006030 [Seirophora lacunosa]